MKIIRLGICLLACIFVVAALYVLSSDDVDQQYEKLKSDFRQLSWLDSQLDSCVLAIRLGRQKQYEPLTSIADEIGQMQRSSFEVPRSDGLSPCSLSVDTASLDGMKSLIAEKIFMTKAFKSDHAISKHALAGFLEDLSRAHQIGLSKPLQNRLMNLELSGLRFNLTGCDVTQCDFESQIAELKDGIAESGEANRAILQGVVSHAEKLVQVRHALDLSIDGLLGLTLCEPANEIMGEVQRKYAEVVGLRQFLRLTFCVVALALLAFCVYRFFAMKKSSTHFRHANENLEDRVEDRTNELSRVNDRLQTLNDENEKLAVVARYTSNSVIISDAQAKVEWVNVGFERATGYELSEIVGKVPGELLHGPKTSKQTLAKIRSCCRRQVPFAGEMIHYRKNGQYGWVYLQINPVRDNDGNATRFVSIVKDITQRKAAEKERDRLHEKLNTAARLAGRAEVATGVLHNVGNVLNSVNVSATLIKETLRQNSVDLLRKGVDMLGDHEAGIVNFLTEDERGRHFPTFIHRLTDSLENERDAELDEIESLLSNIDHIRQIVTAQQSSARRQRLIESFRVAELIDSAIDVVGTSLHRHDIRVEKEIPNWLTMRSERHELMQVLVNLIKNAKEACDDNDNRVISISALEEAGFARIDVKDTGVGIDPDQLKSMFQHGFTTKANGHGFGLHAAAITASELGGALSAHSDGKNLGATFTLRIPLQPENTNTQVRSAK